MSRQKVALSVIVVALLSTGPAACGSYNGGAMAPRASSTGSRTITREMVEKWNVLDAYDAVERAGGFKLVAGTSGQAGVTNRRGRTSVQNANADKPALMIDGTLLQDYSMLRQIRAAQIETIDLLSSIDATQRFGTVSSGAGAIIVMTRRAP